MSDLESVAERPHRTLNRMAPMVYIHAAHRTSSTWFWAKFRENPAAFCYYEPSNAVLKWLTRDLADRLDRSFWDSRHAPTDPYLREYGDLIRASGGVEGFAPEMTAQWFIPQGGLRGTLRPAETDYLARLIRTAAEAGKVPVFGDCWSLGRCWAIREAFGGVHIFQYRNLWQQWLSYLSYKQRGDWSFHVTIMDFLCRDDDAFFQYLVARGLEHAANAPPIRDKDGNIPLLWNRNYENAARDPDTVRKLELLPERYVFTLFMGLHIYLYLHARVSTDLSADVTRMARDEAYRAGIERAVERQTGLAVSFADIADVAPPDGVEFDATEIDWDEIREDAAVAVRHLSPIADPAALKTIADEFIDATIAEARKGAAHPAAVKSDPFVDEGRAKTIGLCMIVKNETKVIERCLESVLPLVDYILVVDTGSTDGTQQLVRDFLAKHKVDGAVIEEPWRDFAYNRSFALQKLREVESVDYAMIIDADDALEVDADFDAKSFKAAMTHDLYDVRVRHGGITHRRPQLSRNRLSFFYKGVVHEYLETPPGALSRGNAEGFAVRASTGGARSQNPRKYQDDAAVLEQALASETDPFLVSRYTFYLAQSYRDCGEREKGVANYLKRAELGFWGEEIYVSLLEAGNLMAALERPYDEVIATWERASKTVPSRAEALHAASHYCRVQGKNAAGQEFARRGLELTQPAHGLFIRPWVYEYGLLDEFSINAYWAGAYRESLDAALKLLASDTLPQSMVKRIAANARFAVEKLPEAKAPPPAAPNLGTLGAESLIDQHKMTAQRSLRSRVAGTPKVLVAILAKQKEAALPLYLDCIEALDYPKSSIALYIRTNNNTDRTETILRDWVARVGPLYASVEFDAADVAARVETFGEHEWNATRFKVLGQIRNASLERARALGCDYYFVADVDNFIRPATLRELVALDLPIAAPLLRSIAPGRFYSNYHADTDPNGYLKGCDQYYWMLERRVRGVVEVPVVHCTYLVRADVIPELTYDDASNRYEYVVFSDSARKAGIPQYLDNRQVYGYITFGEDDKDQYVKGGIERARALLAGAGDSAEMDRAGRAATPIPGSPKPEAVDSGVAAKRLSKMLKRLENLRKTKNLSKDNERELEFIAFCQGMSVVSNSQLFQDAWVLFELNQKRNGYFVEFGASDGVYLSNTLCLERFFGWLGALAEPSPCWADALLNNRKCYISTKCIYGKSGLVVDFHESINSPVLSTINAFVKSDMNAWARANARIVQRETLSLGDFLTEARAPICIDYISIDTEGSELDILETFDFKRYDVKAFTIEHNYTAQRDRIYELMTRNGYVRTFETISAVDDWYIRR